MRRAVVMSLLLGVLLLAALPQAGCQKPLFPAEQPRTQFENHDRMRTGFVPLQEPDVFGNPQPALRTRLMPPK